MKSFLLIILCSIFIAKSYGQSTTNSYGRIAVQITKEKKSSKGNIKIEIISFSGRDSLWVNSIYKNLNQSISIPKHTKKGKYMVEVRFIVCKDGSLCDIACDNDPGVGLCKQVLAIIKKSPKWYPAQQQKFQTN